MVRDGRVFIIVEDEYLAYEGLLHCSLSLICV